MKDRRPWFKFWHEDFWHSERVRVMSAEGVALYLLLLTEQWSQGPLLDDPEFWRKVHGGRFARFEEAWDEVRPCFDLEGDRLVSPRLERERQEAEELLARRREAGSRGGKAKAQKAASRPQEGGSSSKCLASARATPSKHLPIEKEKEKEKEIEKESKKKTTKRRKPSGPVQEALTAFSEAYLAVTGEVYPIAQKDAVQVSRLVKRLGDSWSLDAWKQRVAALAEDPEPFARKNFNASYLAAGGWTRYAPRNGRVKTQRSFADIAAEMEGRS